MENENKNEQKEVTTFDLDNAADIKELSENVLNNGNFFKIDEDVTYKIELTSPKIKPIIKTFLDSKTQENKEITKYVLQIKSVNTKKEKYEGEWEVGSGILKTIVSKYEKDAVFKVSRTGTGMDTKYAVLKDF